MAENSILHTQMFSIFPKAHKNSLKRQQKKYVTPNQHSAKGEFQAFKNEWKRGNTSRKY